MGQRTDGPGRGLHVRPAARPAVRHPHRVRRMRGERPQLLLDATEPAGQRHRMDPGRDRYGPLARGAAGRCTAAGGHRQERGRRVAARARQRGRQRRDEPRTGATAAARREGAGRCGSRVRDERPTSAARPRVSGAPDRAVLGRYREHQVGRRHRGECGTPALPVEHRPLPAVRPRLPAGGQRAADRADAEERVRTGTRRVGSRASAPGAHGTFLVGRGPGAYRRGQHRRRCPMAACPAARRAAQRSWVRWSADWLPKERGPAVLLARATDRTGRTQPDVAVHNTQGYLFDAVVRHGVHVV